MSIVREQQQKGESYEQNQRSSREHLLCIPDKKTLTAKATDNNLGVDRLLQVVREAAHNVLLQQAHHTKASSLAYEGKSRCFLDQ